MRAGLTALAVGAALAGTVTSWDRHSQDVQVPVANGSFGAPIEPDTLIGQEPVPPVTAPPATTSTPRSPSVPPSPPAPSSTSVQPAGTGDVATVVALVNQARADRSQCGPLRVDDQLTKAAQRHASDMATRDYLEHDTPEGVTFAERILDAGYPRPGAENIAQGQRTARTVMESWMTSPGHRANILNCRLRTIGVGLDVNGWYWVQDFGF